MALSRLYRSYRSILSLGHSAWGRWLSASQRLTLLMQVTQWQTETMSDEEYRHWI
ncbi:glucose uptake inhibitor SgrT [Lonsdalea quercina]|uniref:glucose uptake inhibitor SgrT n=1 Tax=Lonsdalea quercina TaxID=71657 RepID=UPI0039766317